MSTDVYRMAGELAAKGVAFAVATVVRVEGSSSAKPGSKAIIDAEGRLVAGWVGGGCAESAVRTQARQCIAEQRVEVLTLDLMDEVLGVGMPCGGVMEIYIEPVLPKPELLIVGHGRIAETLASLGYLMNFSITVTDPAADRKSFPTADRLITDDLDLSATPVGKGTYVVVATQHKNDHVYLQRALESEVAYVALVASSRRSKLVLGYLVSAGVPKDKLDTVWAPAGLDLRAGSPEEIALSVMSQIVALRRGGSCQPLKERGAGSASRSQLVAAGKVITQCET